MAVGIHREVVTERCPRCNAPFEAIVTETTCYEDLRDGLIVGKEEQRESAVTCQAGHRFTLTGMERPKMFAVLMWDAGLLRGGHDGPAPSGPCVVCGVEFQSGQLYVKRDGPRHVWCKA